MTKAKKKAQKAEKGKKGRGGSDSGSNSRASTPVSDRQGGGGVTGSSVSGSGGTRQQSQAGKRGTVEEERRARAFLPTEPKVLWSPVQSVDVEEAGGGGAVDKVLVDTRYRNYLFSIQASASHIVY